MDRAHPITSHQLVPITREVLRQFYSQFPLEPVPEAELGELENRLQLQTERLRALAPTVADAVHQRTQGFVLALCQCTRKKTPLSQHLTGERACLARRLLTASKASVPSSRRWLSSSQHAEKL
eukprot:1161212-Pelagomonas_calceolata.AAC.7